MNPIGPKSAEFAKGFDDTVSHTLMMRQWLAVSDAHRFLLEGRTYYVSGVVHSPDFRSTTLYVTEVP